MKKLMMLLIAMINIFAFTGCNNDVTEGSDDYKPDHNKDWFIPNINDVPGMLEGKTFLVNEEGFNAKLESGEIVNYPNFSITFKKNSILILTDDNDLDNYIELNSSNNNIQYVEKRSDREDDDGSSRGTYIEYKSYKNAEETNHIQLAFFGKKDNFCIGILFNSYSEKIGFSTGSLNYLYEVSLTGNDIDVLFNDLHKNYLTNIPKAEKLNSISDAYVLLEIFGGLNKNMYAYGIFKINNEKRIQEMYYIGNSEYEYTIKLNNVNEEYFWLKTIMSEKNLQSDGSYFSVTIAHDIEKWASYCILTSEIYEKYSKILPQDLF